MIPTSAEPGWVFVSRSSSDIHTEVGDSAKGDSAGEVLIRLEASVDLLDKSDREALEGALCRVHVSGSALYGPMDLTLYVPAMPSEHDEFNLRDS